MEDAGINTLVVKALMSLRGMTTETLASVLQVRTADLSRWLDRDEADAVPAHRQMEVLAMLGVYGESLRSDVVHYWRVAEPVFGRASSVYSALHLLTGAFGKAQVVYLAQESDPAFSLRATAHYGLKFPGFYAILEVQASPFFNFKFGPEVSSGLSWMDGTVGLLLENDKYLALEPGAVRPEDLAEQVDTVQNVLKWEQLTELAKTVKVSPDQLAALVHKVANNQLAFSPSESGVTEVPAPEVAAHTTGMPPAASQPQEARPPEPEPKKRGSFSYVT